MAPNCPVPQWVLVSDSIQILEELKARALVCTQCRLAETRTQVVFGVGDPQARLMFVGEAPGQNEDLQGEPFVGAAGKLLDTLLGEIGMQRSERVHRQRPQMPSSGQS